MRCIIIMLFIMLSLVGCQSINQNERHIMLDVNVATVAEYFCVAAQLDIILNELLVYNPDNESLLDIQKKLKESRANVAELAEHLRKMVESSDLEDTVKNSMFEVLNAAILLGIDNTKVLVTPRGE